MFGRLLRYDLRAALRTLAPIWLSAPVLAVINHFTIRLSDQSDSVFGHLLLSSPMQVLPMLLLIGVLVAMGVLSLTVIIRRFYHGLLGDEGYFAFTLPVRTGQLLLSKFLTAMLVLLGGGVAGGSAFLILGGQEALGALSGVLNVITELLPKVRLSEGQLWILGAEILLLLLVRGSAGVLQIYASISVGHLFRKHRGLLSFVCYLVINSVSSTVRSVLMFAATGGRFPTELPEKLTSFALADPGGAAIITVAGMIVAALIPAVLFWFTSQFILSRHLNLE